MEVGGKNDSFFPPTIYLKNQVARKSIYDFSGQPLSYIYFYSTASSYYNISQNT